MRTLFVKPVTRASGAVAEVFIPAIGRNVRPEGEIVDVTSFVARRIAEGSLVVAEKETIREK